MQLHYRIWVEGSTVYFKITNQEIWIRDHEEAKKFNTIRYVVASYSRPEIKAGAFVYLRGLMSEYNTRAVKYNFGDASLALRECEAIQLALDEFILWKKDKKYASNGSNKTFPRNIRSAVEFA